ncbi:MAG: branched-chain amino acid aminotransferase [Novosphingobium sp.]|uniref:branched-chain amino acid aminotransferase n=1 Tax=Novosphingobium sp. TaxID=1874826 RepID=UPI0032BD1966
MATLADPATRFTRVPHPAPTPAQDRAAILENPGFGNRFTDHMVMIEWSEAAGWHNPTVQPYGPIALDPAASVLHYAQEIFEGLKAYRHPDGSMALFRPEANAARFNASARRLAMPELPDDLFIAAIQELVAVDKDWFPTVEGGSIYLRPFMIATEAFLGVRPAKAYKFLVIASPAGNYFKSGAPAVSIWVSDYTRAAPGGTGAAKCGGNYAASLVPTAEAFAKGHDQVLFLDAAEHRWIEELGGMNLFFVHADGSLATPALSGTILAGVTRDSLIRLARDEGLTVREDRYSLDQWRADAQSGALVEVFACGTAAVVTPVGQVADHTGSFTIGSGGPGQLTSKLKARLTAIQRGEEPDPHGWVMRLG